MLSIQDNEILKNQYHNILDLFENSFKKYSDLIAFENMGSKLTFKDLDRKSKNLAAYLLNNTNLKKGDRIAIQMPNIIQYPISILGALRAGLIVVNINPLYTPYEMLKQLNDSGAKAIIILENFAHKLEKINDKLNNKQTIIITEVGDMMGKLKGLFVNVFLKYIKKIIPKYDLKVLKFKNIIKIGSSLNLKKHYPKKDDIAFLQYTTGTTGTAKGAMLTHNNILSNIYQVSNWMKKIVSEGKEISISPLPLYHIFSLVSFLALLSIGAKNILITNPKNLTYLIKQLKKYPFTLFTGVNTLFKALMNNVNFKTVDFSKCKIIMGGGAAIQEAVARNWEKITSKQIVEAYGLTEASPGVSINFPFGNAVYNTVGRPLIDTKIKIVNHLGKEVKKGEKGELLINGPQIMKGYWNNEKETNEVFSNGWLKTGDIALLDEEDNIQIVDRKKDIVNISGFNVYPNEIDNIVNENPKVLEAASIGIPDEKSGEALKLFVVKKDPSLTKEEIKSFCKEKLTKYKIPKYIEFRNQLPKSTIGKISKKDLKKEISNKEEVLVKEIV